MLVALETATSRGSVARVEAGVVTRLLCLPGERDHNRALAAALSELVDGELERVERFALAIGPGSFTGLRVGVALLKGLGLVLPRPVVPVSSLELVAERAPVSAERVLAAIDARAGDVFAALFRRTPEGLRPDPALPEGLYRADGLGARLDGVGLITGDGAPRLGDPPAGWTTTPEALWAVDAAGVGRLAWGRRDTVSTGVLEPAYLQLAAAEQRRRDAARDTSDEGARSGEDPTPSV